MDFQEINKQLQERTPQAFLTSVLAEKSADDDSILFSREAATQFETNAQYLESAETIALQTIKQWQQNDFLVVGQTIDGDYLAGTLTQTFVIPVSLYQADIETYDLFLADFFVAYTKGNITSSLLPPIQ